MQHRRTVTAVSTAATAVALGLASAGAAHASTTVAVWSMGDTGGTMHDSSGGGHDGTLHSVTARQPGVSRGHGFGFSSRPSYVSVPTAGSLNPGTGDFSFSVWVRFGHRPSSSVGDYDVLRKGLASTDGGYKLEVLANGRASCNFRGSTGQVGVSGGPDLADDAWHHLSCHRTASAVVLGVGSATYTSSGRTGTISNSGALDVGAKGVGGEDQYTGLLDNAVVSRG